MELSKKALFNVATERFKSWSEMYADPDVTPEYMYQDMCASCFSGELTFDWEDRYVYKDGGCSFKHKGVEFIVADLRDMRPDKKLGKERFSPKLTKECVKRLKAAQQNEDVESAHAEADQVLCDLLEAIGFKAIVREYDAVPKWYA